jgi:RHS repeat-associated protein
MPAAGVTLYGNGFNIVVVPASGGVYATYSSTLPTPTISVATSGSPSAYGSAVTFTASVSPTADTSTVTFYNGGTSLGTATPSGGIAKLTTSSLASGSYTITASIAANASYAAATSAAITQVVNNIGPGISVGGGSLTYQVTTSSGGTCPLQVTPTTIYGQITTIIDSGFSFTASGVTTSWSNSASVYLSSPGGSYCPASQWVQGNPLTLTGSTFIITFYPASGTATYTVQPTISVASSGSPSTYGSAVTFTASVSPAADTSTVTFYNGSTSLGTATPSGGIAKLTTSSLPSGSYSITASIAANASYAAAASVAITQVVNKITPTISIGNIPLNPVYGSIATVSYNYSGTESPTESVVSNSTSVCTVSGNTVNFVGVGTCTLTASATATANYNAVVGGAQSFSVGNSTSYSYTASYDAVGNVRSYTDSVMGAWGFSYDYLNRLATGSAIWPNGTAQYACWSYDSFGNRKQQEISSAAFQSGSGGASACNAQSTASLATDLNSYLNTSGIDPGTNRIQSTNARGVTWAPSYDASGDMTSDGANQYLYDAEGRICAIYNSTVVGATMTGYLYNADGARTAKGSITTWSCDPTTNGFQFTENYVLGPGGEELTQFNVTSGVSTWQRTNVYAGGKLLGTYDLVSNGQGGQVPALHFHLQDPLGTRRMQLSGELVNLGQPETDIQSLPYGDGLNSFPDQDARNSTADDSTPLHFTGKERDTESGNDYFGARYYASSMGRFMSPDWSAKYEPVPYAKLTDPQTLNLYAYVLNNPLTHFDPDGHACDSLWHCVQGFLNVIEINVSASVGTQGSVQWGVAKAEYHATVVGVEGKSGLGGGNRDVTASTGIGASASASGGPAKASLSLNAGAQASTSDGFSASASASAKVALGPASESASASVDQDGPHTSLGPGASADKDTDWKIGGSFTAGVGVGVNVNFSQLGRAFGDLGDSLNALGGYIMDNFITPAQNQQPITPTAPFDYHP